MPTPIAIAVVEHDGRFLVGQRPDGVPLAGLWEFPGGKIEPGETPAQAAVRECLEETGLVVEAIGEYPASEHHYAHGRVQLHFIACRLFDPVTPIRDSYRWIPRQELKDYAFPEGNRPLLETLAR